MGDSQCSIGDEMIKIFYFILITSLCIFFFAGCTPRLSQDFIDQYDTPKLTKECPDFSGVYVGKGQVAYVFYNDEVKTGNGKILNVNEYKIVIQHKNQHIIVSIYGNDGLIESYTYDNIFTDTNKYSGEFFRKAGCSNGQFFGRTYYVSTRPEWGGGTKSVYESKLEKLPNGNLKYILHSISIWHGPFGNTSSYEPYEKTIILKRIENE